MEEDKDCVFCKIAKGEISVDKVYENDNFIGILDANPKTEGHTLVIPKKHYKTILDMPDSLGNEIVDAVKRIGLKLIKDGKAEGFNVIMNNFSVAGQVVPHLHVHVIPRKEGDGLNMV